MQPSPFQRLWNASWGPGGLSRTAYGMLCVATLAQGVTVAMTWPLWQVRDSPPNLPVIDLPQVSFGVVLMISLVAILLRPRMGVALHAAIMLVSCVFDQYRTQPQFAANVLLMVACLAPAGAAYTRWFLAGMWFWAGLHKFLSPDWFTHRSWDLTSNLGVPSAEYHLAFAFVVAAVELSLGVAAMVAPKKAAYGCVAIHVGIVVFLSPWFAGWNYSVIPWNLATAVIGYWLLQNCADVLPRTRWEGAFAAANLLLPAGFYFGWVDHGYASVLYSDSLPNAVVTTPSGTHEIEGWGELCVPFPSERRLFVQHFARSPEFPIGSKLHVADPRPWLDDLYFVKRTNGQAEAISREEFYASANDEVVGVGNDCRRCIFALTQAGARLLRRTPKSAIYAIEIPPAKYHPDLLQHLAGLPNLEQIQLEDCALTDRDLATFPPLPRLVGIGLVGTPVTEAGIFHLRKFPALELVQTEEADRAERE